jgi:RimJ/RimL family protein N-acetyltransferase
MPSHARVAIETPRLLLLPTHERYAEAVFANFTAEITTYMFPAPARTIDETLAFLRSARASMEAGKEIEVVILNRDTEEFLGHGGLHHVDTRTPELGIWIKKAAHGNGYGMEAIAGLAGWADANLAFDYLIYPVDRRNVASRRIPEALGGVVAAEYTRTSASGNLLDLLEYRIDAVTLFTLMKRRQEER